MTDHRWMIDVLEDLEKFAASNELNSLQCLLSEARSRVEVEFNLHTAAKEQTESYPSAEWLN